MADSSVHIARNGRTFAGYPAAVLSFIVDSQQRVLMLAHPKRGERWEVINGAMDAGETILEAVLRETAEEAGPDIKVRPLGAFHVYTFRFDDRIPHMISICYLCAYQGGQVNPGSDMRGSTARWWSLDEIEQVKPHILVPYGQEWTFIRAVELYSLWKDQGVSLQPRLTGTKNKYERLIDK